MNIKLDRKLRMGMVGGGKGAFIGAVHKMAAELDGDIELVCGVFSRNYNNTIETAQMWHLPFNRAYRNYKEMFKKEKLLPEGERMDFVCIVTPNNMHYPIAMAALEAGFHVVCDKPMTVSLEEAKKLRKKVKESGKLFCLTHTYTGYPMVKEARRIITSGELGNVRRVVVEYPQGWLARRIELEGQKQAVWRTDPRQAGASCCMGDIGTHCANLAEYITGLKIKSVCADLTSFVTDRKLDDDGSVLLRFENGAKGVLWASQIAVGKENGLNIRVYCEKGSIEFYQEEPNTLIVRHIDKPMEILRTGTPYVGEEAKRNTRLPAGHPEGYIEAFANIYRAFTSALKDYLSGVKVDESKYDYPTVEEGVRGMAFIEAVVKSSKAKEKWLKI